MAFTLWSYKTREQNTLSCLWSCLHQFTPFQAVRPETALIIESGMLDWKGTARSFHIQAGQYLVWCQFSHSRCKWPPRQLLPSMIWTEFSYHFPSEVPCCSQTGIWPIIWKFYTFSGPRKVERELGVEKTVRARAQRNKIQMCLCEVRDVDWRNGLQMIGMIQAGREET